LFKRQPPKPRYWKALLATALFLAPIAYSVHFFIRMPNVAWAPLFIGSTLAFSSIVYMRMQNDWRVADTMNLNYFHRRTTVKRNVNVKRR